MLRELRNCNNIGDAEGLLFLISIIKGKEEIGKTEIRNRCLLKNNVNVHPLGAIAFFEYLGLVSESEDTVIPLLEFNNLAVENDNKIIDKIVETSIDKLFEDGIFDNNATVFNVEKGCLAIRKSAFPLSYAAIRNFLITVAKFDYVEDEYIYINVKQEADFIKKIKKRRKYITIEQLLKQQEEQNQRGLAAEEFVLQLEKERLPEKANKIRRISDFDVTAGYDIVSYENSDSKEIDRFIEVKSYVGKPHFYWSKNEAEVAQINAERYLLCLVDYSKIREKGYQPEYIRNPYKVIFSKDAVEWFVEAESYKITKI